jgi:UMF1 family MFS transporter
LKSAASKVAGLNWRQVLPWALYDWANSGYAATVLAAFFPVFFKDYWNPPGTKETVSDFRLTAAISTAGVIVAILAPALGAIGDRGNARKKFLGFFAALGILATASLHFIPQGQWQMAMFVYAFSLVGFSGANIFYDSFLVNVAEERRLDLASAIGYALGYVGGGILLLFNVAMTINPQRFGLSSSSEAVLLSFLIVAVWWAVFSIPLFLFVREPKKVAENISPWRAIHAGFRQLADTFREIRKIRVVFIFLCAYWLYIDGVDTIINVATAYGRSLGFTMNQLIQALLITQFIGLPSAIAFGFIGQKIGARTGIFIALAVYFGVTVYGYFMDSPKEFFVLATVIGLVQGGVQSLSRSLYARLIPKDKSGEFFGFYNMLGKFAAILGPAIYGFVGLQTGNPRLAIFAIASLFIAGGVLLCFVREPKHG